MQFLWLQHVFTSWRTKTKYIMAEAVVMPRQGQSVETCVITQWLKNKGDQVEEGDLLFSYETDKAAFDEVAPVSGTLLEILFEEGDEVPVLQTVAIIGEPGEKTGQLPGGSASGRKARGGQVESEPVMGEKAPGGQAHNGQVKGEKAPGGQVAVADTYHPGVAAASAGSASGIRISPRARNMAAAMHVDISTLQGSGPNGRIIADDIEAAVAHSKKILHAEAIAPGQEQVKAPVQSPLPEQQETVSSRLGAPSPAQPGNDEAFTDQPLSNIRKVIARNMKASLDNSAQLTHHASADARRILSLRKKIKDGNEQRLPVSTTLNDMVCFAIVQVLKDTPGMNSHFLGDRTRSFRGVHLGIAVDTPRGLMVPVLKNADRLTLGGLGQSLRELAESCRTGNIDPDLLASDAGTFTVSNLGAFGIEMFTPVLNLPQTGIIGINTITPRPADLGDGNIGFVPHIGISLTYDHRAIDGAPASRFLQEVCKRIAGFDPKL